VLCNVVHYLGVAVLHHAGKGARSERGTFDSLQQLDIAFQSLEGRGVLVSCAHSGSDAFID
jgi:hypothetical protein